MATRLGTAYIPIEGDWNRFNRDLKTRGNSLGAGFAKLGSDLGRTLSHGVATAAKVGMAGVGASFVYAIKKASDFESQLSSLSAVTSANATQMDRLRAQALKAGAATKFSALEAAKAQTELAKGGLSVAQISKGGLSAALALAAAGELDLADAASTTVNAMKLFGLRGKDAMKVADGLATAANTTTADVSDFRLALQQAGSAAKTSGLSFGETITALETLADVGIKGSDAGTSLKTMLLQLASPTSLAAADMAKQLGINVFDASGNMRSLVDVSASLQKGLGGLTREQRIQAATTLVGQDGFRALLALYDAGPKKIARYEQQLNKSGTAADVAKTKQDNLKGALENLSGSVETLAISVGTKAIPILRDLTDDVTAFTNKVNKVLSRNDLTLGEKVNRIFDEAKVDAKPWIDKIGAAIEKANIPERIGNAVESAVPKLADALASAAPKAAGTFVTAFLGAGPWGRLLVGAFLLKKMGGLGAFARIGTRAGATMGTSMAAAAGRSTGWKGAASRIGRTIGGPAAIAAAIAFGPEFAKRIKRDLDSTTGGKGIKFELPKNQFAPGVGLVGPLKDAQKGILRVLEGSRQDLRDWGETAEKTFNRLNGQNTEKARDELRKLASQARTSAAQFPDFRKGLTRFAESAEDAARRANAALGKQWVGQIQANFRALSRSGKVNLDAIRNTVRSNMKIVRDRLGSDSEAGRKAVAKNFRLAAKAIQTQMDAGVISTKEGSRLIRVYLRKAREAMGLTQSQAEALRKTGTLLNSDDRPGRSTILAPTAKGATKASKKRTSDKKKAPADETQKKTTKTVKARTGASKIAGADVDTLNVNRLIVGHLSGDLGGKSSRTVSAAKRAEKRAEDAARTAHRKARDAAKLAAANPNDPELAKRAKTAKDAAQKADEAVSRARDAVTTATKRVREFGDAAKGASGKTQKVAEAARRAAQKERHKHDELIAKAKKAYRDSFKIQLDTQKFDDVNFDTSGLKRALVTKPMRPHHARSPVAVVQKEQPTTTSEPKPKAHINVEKIEIKAPAGHLPDARATAVLLGRELERRGSR